MDLSANPLSRAQNFVEAIEHQAAARSQATAFTYLEQGEKPSESITYVEIDRIARGIGAFLQARADPGSRVLLVVPNRLESILALVGCLYASVVAVPVAPPKNQRSTEQLCRIAASAETNVVLTFRSIRERLPPYLREQGVKFDWLVVEDFPAGLDEDWSRPSLSSRSLALMQFTSGSTGNPKGVMLSHGNLIHNCRLLDSAFGFESGFRMVSWLPFYHDWGLIGCVLFPLSMGMPCWIMEPEAFLYNPTRWLRAISRFKANISCAPNFAYELFIKSVGEPERETLSLNGWEVAMVGAEPVRFNTLESFSKSFSACGFRKTAFYPSYGLAESTLIVTGGCRKEAPISLALDRSALEKGRVVPVPPGSKPDVKVLISCGSPLGEQRVSIVDPVTRLPCSEGTVGEVRVSGPSVAHGYWGQRSGSQHIFNGVAQGGERSVSTGDLGFMWEGQLFICGRAKDVIIKAGRNLFADDIEQCAERSHPALRTGCGAAFAVDEGGAERLVIVYELNYGEQPDVRQLIGCIQRAVYVGHAVTADAIAIIRPGTLQKTPNGKIRRQQMKTLFLSRQLELVGSWQGW